MSGDNFSRRYSVVAEARRHWSEVEKQAIVAEAERPGVNISAVARRHGIKPSLLFRWRRMARDRKDRQSTPAFIPVTLALPAAEPPSVVEADASSVPPPPVTSGEPAEHRIEIALGNGRVVRVGAGVDVDSLRRILDAVDGR